MECVYKKTESLKKIPNPYCPGCHHGIAQKLMCEVIDEMGIRGRTVYASSVGCNGLSGYFVNLDTFPSQHGRCAAAASAFKRVNPDSILLCYQGDGDAASIGTAESIHAARRGEPITVIFANNTLYGMTGGQTAPTTLIGQRSATARDGNGYAPIHFAEMIATLDAPAFVARCAVNTPKNIFAYKRALKKALEYQVRYGKYCFVEVLTACVTSGGIKPEDSIAYIDRLTEVFPLGVLKDEDPAAQDGAGGAGAAQA